MGLVRFLLLFAIAWLIWRVLLRPVLSPPTEPPRQRQTRDQDYLPLTKCAICGAHIPRPSSNAAPICERCRSR